MEGASSPNHPKAAMIAAIHDEFEILSWAWPIS
jgi:hypothetical protein